MRKYILLSLSLIAGQLQTFAQSDTAQLDLGYLKLNSPLTQSITIKAKDLQPYPFANLAEAVNVWFNGALTSRGNVQYIVDGNPLTDANVFSIYDIEEITLVQNAATLYATSGAGAVVLVKTKRKAGKKNEWEAAAQAYVVSRRQYNPLNDKTTPSEKEWYQQVYLGYRHRVKGLNVGVSANYLHDVAPRPKDMVYERSKPFQLNRFRLNGYADQQLGRSTQLGLSLNYTPQQISSELELRSTLGSTPSTSTFLFQQKNPVFNGSLNVTTDLKKGWSNHFTAAYTTYYLNTDIDNTRAFSGNPQTDSRDSTLEAKNWWVRNQLAYTARVKHWQFRPSVNLVYRRIHDEFNAVNITTTNNLPTGMSNASMQLKGYLLQLVPSLQVQYKDVFSVQVGLLQSLRQQPDNVKKFTPFITASANVARLLNADATWSLTTFASYAVANNAGLFYHALNDLSYTSVWNSNITYTSRNTSKGANQWQLGAAAGFSNNRLQVSYNRQQSAYHEELRFQVPAILPPVYTYVTVQIRTTLHRAGLHLQAIDGAHVKWTTGVHASARSTRLVSGQITPGAKQPTEWTGGWVNRVQYKALSLQLDLLYALNRQWFNPFVSPQRAEKINSFSLQNVSISYRLQVPRFQQWEVYAGARNLFENKKSFITDNRRFYGGGVKVTL